MTLEENMVSIISAISTEVNQRRQLPQLLCDYDAKNTASDWIAAIGLYATLAGARERASRVFDAKRFRKYITKAAGQCVLALLALDNPDGMPKRHWDE